MKKMKVANSLAHRFHQHRSDTHDLAARLAPLEELLSQEADEQTTQTDGSAVVAQENGAIVVGRHTPTLRGETIAFPHRKPYVERVVIVIVGLMLAFIMFIAWQIYQMPRN